MLSDFAVKYNAEAGDAGYITEAYVFYISKSERYLMRAYSYKLWLPAEQKKPALQTQCRFYFLLTPFLNMRHQAFTFPQLGRCQHIFLIRKRVFTLFKLDADRRSHHFQ